jgi:tol-pal system protein YbgF
MRKLLGLGLAAALFVGPVAAQDKEKKTYELIYQDIQFLKQQYQKLEKKVDDATDALANLGNLVRDLTAQVRLIQSSQAQSQDKIKDLPLQLQALLERLGQFEADLFRISSDLADVKAKVTAPPPTPPAEAEPAAKKTDNKPAQKKAGPAQKKEPEPVEKKEAEKPPIKTNLSIQEAYNIAYVDYQKGNFDLAVAGFQDLIQQFPDKPLTDDAVYMIGECYYSQKKFDKAVEQFDDLIVGYPLSNRIAAAYLKKGYALAELKKPDEAIAVLRLLIAKFSVDEEAKAAQEKIKELQAIKK